MAKQVKFGSDARERMLRGVDTLANAQCQGSAQSNRVSNISKATEGSQNVQPTWRRLRPW